MSASASQARKFYKEVARHAVVWTIRDDGGYPAPFGSEGKRAMPFWSSRSRVERIVASVPAYKDFEVVSISWIEFVETWLPGLVKDGLLVGVNWSGPRATGYDLQPDSLKSNVHWEIDQLSQDK